MSVSLSYPCPVLQEFDFCCPLTVAAVSEGTKFLNLLFVCPTLKFYDLQKGGLIG